VRIAGPYAWVRRNDARALVFLIGFALLSQLMAVIALFGPLTILDPIHAPLGSWTGYAVRYAPLVALTSAAYFLFQMTRDVSVVRRDAPFRFVDSTGEFRLCSLVEPLGISLGLGAQHVGVMETDALNAFACGSGRRDATLVVTRGLLDALDDDELSAVIAHELVHLRNGDTRTIAAANVFMRTMSGLSRINFFKPRRYWQSAAMLFVPVLFPIYLCVALLAQTCIRLGRASRLLISSAREFVADTEAARLTQHPAALVSALRKIEGRSALPQLPLVCEAMMIDGAAVGALATHPPISARIQALVAVTGRIALEDRPRRDTRMVRPAETTPVENRGGAAIRTQMSDLLRVAATAKAPHHSAMEAVTRVGADGQMSILGLRWDMAAALLASFCTAVVLNHGDRVGLLGRMGYVLKPRPAAAQWMIERVTACRNAEAADLVGAKTSLAACANDADMIAHTKAMGLNQLPDGRLVSNVQMAMLSPSELGRAATSSGLNRPPTDLAPSYQLSVHEAWDRLAHGDLTRYLESQRCGVFVDVRVDSQLDRSVTWHVTSEGQERIRFVATLDPDGDAATHVTLGVLDLQSAVMAVDGANPQAPPFRWVTRPALATPLRPAFAEAAAAMLEDRLFRIGNVERGGRNSGLDSISGGACSNQRLDFEASGQPFGFHAGGELR
jgi:Zn-dependent protease with chaperone function